MKIRQHIPNFITILNLLSGCTGIFFALQGKTTLACFAIYASGLFDFFDGFVARLLHASSEIGKSLDSLADMVSFGVLPAAILFQIIQGALLTADPMFTIENAGWQDLLLLCTPLLIVAFSALRLANFNTDSRQTYGFIGVPTPANAMLISSFPFIISQHGSMGALLLSRLYVLIPLTVVLCFMMVAELPMISLKFKNFGIKDNKFKYLLIVFTLAGLLWLGISAIPVIFGLYLLFSFFEYQASKSKNPA